MISDNRCVCKGRSEGMSVISRWEFEYFRLEEVNDDDGLLVQTREPLLIVVYGA